MNDPFDLTSFFDALEDSSFDQAVKENQRQISANKIELKTRGNFTFADILTDYSEPLYDLYKWLVNSYSVYSKTEKEIAIDEMYERAEEEATIGPKASKTPFLAEIVKSLVNKMETKSGQFFTQSRHLFVDNVILAVENNITNAFAKLAWDDDTDIEFRLEDGDREVYINSFFRRSTKYFGSILSLKQTSVYAAMKAKLFEQQRRKQRDNSFIGCQDANFGFTINFDREHEDQIRLFYLWAFSDDNVLFNYYDSSTRDYWRYLFVDYFGAIIVIYISANRYYEDAYYNSVLKDYWMSIPINQRLAHECSSSKIPSDFVNWTWTVHPLGRDELVKWARKRRLKVIEEHCSEELEKQKKELAKNEQSMLEKAALDNMTRLTTRLEAFLDDILYYNKLMGESRNGFYKNESVSTSNIERLHEELARKKWNGLEPELSIPYYWIACDRRLRVAKKRFLIHH